MEFHSLWSVGSFAELKRLLVYSSESLDDLILSAEREDADARPYSKVFEEPFLLVRHWFLDLDLEASSSGHAYLLEGLFYVGD